MNKKEILEQIVSNEGDCDWILNLANPLPIELFPCNVCPLNRLKKRDGEDTYLSCYDAVGDIQGNEDIKMTYKRIAEGLLFDIAVEEAINGEV